MSNTKVNYQILTAYFRTPEWLKLRTAKLDSTSNTCERCGSSNHVDVFHKNHDNMFKETIKDLEVICKVCQSKDSSLPKLSKNNKAYKKVSAYKVKRYFKNLY